MKIIVNFYASVGN